MTAGSSSAGSSNTDHIAAIAVQVTDNAAKPASVPPVSTTTPLPDDAEKVAPSQPTARQAVASHHDADDDVPPEDEDSWRGGEGNMEHALDELMGEHRDNTAPQLPPAAEAPAGQLAPGPVDQPTNAWLAAQLQQLQARHDAQLKQLQESQDELRAALELGRLRALPPARARERQPRRVITLPEGMTVRQAWQLYCCGDGSPEQEPWMNLVHDSSVQLLPGFPASHFRNLMRAVMEAVVGLSAWHDNPTPEQSLAMLRRPELPGVLLGSKVKLRHRLEDSAWMTVRKHLPVLASKPRKAPPKEGETEHGQEREQPPSTPLVMTTPPGGQTQLAQEAAQVPSTPLVMGPPSTTDRDGGDTQAPPRDNAISEPLAAPLKAGPSKRNRQTTEAPTRAQQQQSARSRRAAQKPTKETNADAAPQDDAEAVATAGTARAARASNRGSAAAAVTPNTAEPASKRRKQAKPSTATTVPAAPEALATPAASADISAPSAGERTTADVRASSADCLPASMDTAAATAAGNADKAGDTLAAAAPPAAADASAATSDRAASVDPAAAAAAASTDEDEDAHSNTAAASGRVGKRRSEEDHQGSSTPAAKRARGDLGGTTIHCALASLPPNKPYLKGVEAAINKVLHARYRRHLHVVSPDGDCAFHTMSFFSGIPQHLLRWTAAVATAIRISAANLGAGAAVANPVDLTAGAATPSAAREADEAFGLMGPFIGLPDAASAAVHDIQTPKVHVDAAVLTVVCRILQLHVVVLMVADGKDPAKWNLAPLTGDEVGAVDERVRLVVFYGNHYSPCVLETPVEAGIVPPCLGFPEVVEVLCADVAALPPIAWPQPVPGRDDGVQVRGCVGVCLDAVHVLADVLECMMVQSPLAATLATHVAAVVARACLAVGWRTVERRVERNGVGDAAEAHQDSAWHQVRSPRVFCMCCFRYSR